MLAYCMSSTGLQGLVMTFIASDPGWQCVGNSTRCNATGVIKSSMKNYNDRCSLSDNEWIFPPGSSSIVIEVCY